MKRKTNYSADNAKYFGKKKAFDPIFNLRVPEKQKNKDWYMDYMDYVIPYTRSRIDEYDKLKGFYDIYNGDLSRIRETLQKFCDPLGENAGEYEEDIIAYPKLHNKINVLKGELIKRNDNFKVILLSDSAVKDKNEQLVAELQASVEEEIALEIERNKKQMEGMKPEEANQFVEQLRQSETPEDILVKDFKSEWEIFYNKVLKMSNVQQDIKRKRMETLEDAVIADRFFIHSSWRFGKPHIEVRNPLYLGFKKDPNEFYVEKGDYIWYEKPRTISQIWEDYGEWLDDRDLEELGMHTYSRTTRIDARHNVMDGATPVLDTLSTDMARDMVNGSLSENGGLHQGNSDRASRENLIWETHFEFKAFRETQFLSYPDPQGKLITTIVGSEFKIPKSATKIKFTNQFGDPSVKWKWLVDEAEYSVEKVWIPRKYEVVRLNGSIFPIYREVPFQNTNIDAPFSTFSLSTKGAIFSSRNSQSVSLFERGLPLYMQLLFIKHIQNRELAKYQGYVQDVDVDQIPEELGKDINGEVIRDPIKTWFLYRKRLGVNFYSGSQTTLGASIPSTRSPGSNSQILSTAQDIYNLQMLADMIDREMGLAMGISPQREAAFSNNSNVRDNQQAITQSHHITEPLFFAHSLIWKSGLEDYLRNYRTYCEMVLDQEGKKEHFLHYVLPDGSDELLRVTPKTVQMIDFVLQVSNSGDDQRYADIMLNLTHAFGQNAGEGVEAISSLVKAITNGSSPEETHKLIQLESKKQMERAQQMQKASEEANQQLTKMEIESREDEQAHEKELLIMKGEIDKHIKAMDVFKNQEDLDSDKDGVPDHLEVYKAGVDADFKAAQLDQASRKMDQDDAKLEYDRQKDKQELLEREKDRQLDLKKTKKKEN